MDAVEVKAWMKEHGYTRRQIADDLSLSPVKGGTVDQVFWGYKEGRRVKEWLLVRGCPEEFILPGVVKRYRSRGQQPVQKIKRHCLKCDDPFMAEGRFNRICPKCTDVNRQYVDVGRYQVRR